MYIHVDFQAGDQCSIPGTHLWVFSSREQINLLASRMVAAIPPRTLGPKKIDVRQADGHYNISRKVVLHEGYK